MNSDGNNGGKKRCKCKKSKCLKLYCECFAAGWYCDETCSCQGCFNSRDYEDTVEETRELIESKNPIAFSSKIQCPVEPPASQNVEDGDQVKPVAGKHRKGCNCKKSMCQKKYCECYQANVGCSTDCRCLGCQNKFGKRADPNVYNESTNETVENEMQSSRSRFSLHEFNNSHNLTPSTPFQHFSHENDPSTTGSYTPSPVSANSNVMFGTTSGNYDTVTSYQQTYLNTFVNQFTPPAITHINATHVYSVMNISPMMDLPNCSTPSGSYSSAISWPGSLMNPVNVSSGPEVMNSNKKPFTSTRLDFTR
ncbi:putative transcription factor Tesmin family [Helianthus annuus]|nr:putative transcription factor Tesmin family [Helianthus annuus]